MDTLEVSLNEFQHHPYKPALNMGKVGSNDFVMVCFQATGIMYSSHTTVQFYNYENVKPHYQQCPYIPPIQYQLQESENTFHRVFFLLSHNSTNNVHNTPLKETCDVEKKMVTLTKQTCDVLEQIECVRENQLVWQDKLIPFEIGKQNVLAYELINYQYQVKQEKRKAYDSRGKEEVGKYSVREIKTGVAEIPTIINVISNCVTLRKELDYEYEKCDS